MIAVLFEDGVIERTYRFIALVYWKIPIILVHEFHRSPAIVAL